MITISDSKASVQSVGRYISVLVDLVTSRQPVNSSQLFATLNNIIKEYKQLIDVFIPGPELIRHRSNYFSMVEVAASIPVLDSELKPADISKLSYYNNLSKNLPATDTNQFYDIDFYICYLKNHTEYTVIDVIIDVMTLSDNCYGLLYDLHNSESSNAKHHQLFLEQVLELKGRMEIANRAISQKMKSKNASSKGGKISSKKLDGVLKAVISRMKETGTKDPHKLWKYFQKFSYGDPLNIEGYDIYMELDELWQDKEKKISRASFNRYVKEARNSLA